MSIYHIFKKRYCKRPLNALQYQTLGIDDKTAAARRAALTEELNGEHGINRSGDGDEPAWYHVFFFKIYRLSSRLPHFPGEACARRRFDRRVLFQAV